MSRMDARLMEMQFLAKLDRDGAIERWKSERGSAEFAMVVSLIRDGCLNGIESMSGYDSNATWQRLLEYYDSYIGGQIGMVRGGHAISIAISHKGRVRLSELEQQLRSGRDRDPTGLCLAKRHLSTDLAIAVLHASPETPLSLAFIDMNGLKAINDAHGHDVGDEAIHAFLSAAVATLVERGDAYRGEGGDEVVFILPGIDDGAAKKLLDGFVRQLGKEALALGAANAETRLTASCGSASTTDPGADAGELIKRADKVMYRAKAESKDHEPRVSAVAVGDGEVATFAPGGD